MMLGICLPGILWDDKSRQCVIAIGNAVATYDVDSTFEGFKLILFRVRASGTGML
jgi:hypothetical protein